MFKSRESDQIITVLESTQNITVLKSLDFAFHFQFTLNLKDRKFIVLDCMVYNCVIVILNNHRAYFLENKNCCNFASLFLFFFFLSRW